MFLPMDIPAGLNRLEVQGMSGGGREPGGGLLSAHIPHTYVTFGCEGDGDSPDVRVAALKTPTVDLFAHVVPALYSYL